MAKHTHAFQNCFYWWARSKHNPDYYAYGSIEDFNKWAMEEYNLTWDSKGNVLFGDPVAETAFLLRWA